MAQFYSIYDVDLQTRSRDSESLLHPIGEGDAYGAIVGARVTNGGVPVDLGGQCVGYVKRGDGSTVPRDVGHIDGNLAWLTLDQECCKIEGPIQVAVLWVSDDIVTTLVIAYGTVVSTKTGNIVQPSTPIPDLTQLLAEIETMRQATAAANAAATKAVRYNEAQTLTAAEQAQARGNIGAASADALSTLSASAATKAELAAETAVREAADSDLKSALDETTFDIAQMCDAPNQYTHNGITFGRNGSVFTANGTATNTAFVNIFLSKNSLPIGVKAGNKLRFYVSTSDASNLRCVVYFFNESETQIGNTYYISTDRIVDLPSDLYGIQIRVQVQSGITMTNGTISVKIYPNVYDNDSYAEFKAADDRAVRFDAEQTLNSTQKQTARVNIGAASESNLSDLNKMFVANKALDEILDCKNLFDYSQFYQKTHNGVLFKKLEDGTIQIQGTATDTAFVDLYINDATIPTWMSKNKQYYIIYSSENVAIRVLPLGGATTASLVNTTGDSSFSLPDDTVGLIIRLVVESGTTVDETVLPVITETLPDKLLPKTLEKVTGSVYKYQDISAQASGELIHVDDVSPLTLVNVSGLLENHDIIVCGKNIYHNPHTYTTHSQNNVTKTFSEINGTITVSSSGATAPVVYPNIVTSLNGIGWAGLYKFSLPMDAVVTITPNASRDLFIYDRIFLQFSDGTNTWPVRGKFTTLLCKANTEYGLRVYVDTGFNETVTLKPQIEINGFPTDFEPFTGVYTQDGSTINIGDRTTSPAAIMATSNTINVISQSGSVTLTYVRMNRVDKGVDAFAREKMPIPKMPLMLTFIDDDTTNYALVKLYHDTMQELGAVGNYAVITNHLEADNTLRDLLLEYESEGFGMLCHASNQSGEHTDYFRPWEYRDIDAVRENMLAGLRYMRQTGFISGSFWITPYGVDDPEIKGLAKSLGFQGLISGMNYSPSFRGYTSRYEIPRYSIESNDITKQGMDACIPNGGWVIVTTHANTWGDDVVTYKEMIGEIINYANTIGMKVVNFQEGFETFFGFD